MPPESRAEYFKDRRAKFKSFTVEVEREKMEAFERKLQERQESKKEWSEKGIVCRPEWFRTVMTQNKKDTE